jgi:2-polyprenyl-6-methoxyphenol hydroxylase-like FAD-dependent oxidoreductase
MAQERVPVLIAGTGDAGLSLSLLLLQEGVRPVLIERRSDVSWYPPLNEQSRPLHARPEQPEMRRDATP